MSQPFVGEIKLFGGNFQINGYAYCNGQLMSIAQNDVLFNLIGTTYGGDGQNTFALPDLRSRVPIHQGNLAGGSTYSMGQMGGVETVTLMTSQLPVHSHTPNCNTSDGSQASPANSYWGLSGSTIYSTNAPASPMNAAAVGVNGGNQPHDNMLPFQCVNFIISLFGVFPSPN